MDLVGHGRIARPCPQVRAHCHQWAMHARRQPPPDPVAGAATRDRLAEEFSGRDFGAKPGEFAIGRPVTTTPLTRPRPPAVEDWEQEAREQAAAQAALDAERRRLRGQVGPESLDPAITEDEQAVPAKPTR
jgi:hypothetical protein